MEHIDAEIVFGVDICTMLDKDLTGIWVALERSKVEGSKAIAVVLLVDPVCDVMFSHTRLYQIEECFKTL